MRVLVIGGGGREAALVWKLSQSPRVDRLFAAPGNAGMAALAERLPVGAEDVKSLLAAAREHQIDLAVVGPEAPLVAGIADVFQREGIRVFGPDQRAALLEGSKSFAKSFMKKHGIPTARFETFDDPNLARAYIDETGAPIVVKASGLAAGKGVYVCRTLDEAYAAVDGILVRKRFGKAGAEVVIEEFFTGPETTVLALVDGESLLPMVPTQDHKPVGEGDTGPNTGGMGAYSPVPVVDEVAFQRIFDEVMTPTLKGLKAEGIDYRGVLYFGIMLTDAGPKLLEYNVRFGDPETQVVLPRMETDLVDAIDAVLGQRLDRFDIDWSPLAAACVVMASGGYPGDYEKGKLISGLEAAARVDNALVFHAGTELVGSDVVTAGGRALGVTALGDDLRQAVDRAYDAVDRIRFEGMYFRRDIGWRALGSV